MSELRRTARYVIAVFLLGILLNSAFSAMGQGEPGKADAKQTGAIAKTKDDIPTTQYKRELIHRVASEWYKTFSAVREHLDLGSIKVHLLVTRDGCFHEIHVTSLKRNDLLEKISLQALQRVKPSPIPDDVDSSKPLELSLTFQADP